MLLKFKDSSRKCFYWLQEPKDDKDEEFMKKVNAYMYMYVHVFGHGHVQCTCTVTVFWSG